MDPANIALTKLAEELTDRVAFLEQENDLLKRQQKQASVAEPAPVVSAEVAHATCDELVKCGALDSSQVDETCRLFMTDPAAAHNCIRGILYAQAQSKSASADTAVQPDVAGGTLVDGDTFEKSASEDCLERMQRILNMN